MKSLCTSADVMKYKAQTVSAILSWKLYSKKCPAVDLFNISQSVSAKNFRFL